MDLSFYYPGWVRKAVTFSLDDGNVPLEKKFFSYTKPAGLRGTFNLCTPLERLTIPEYREFYRGYEIANHCRYHAYPFAPKWERPISEEVFHEESADPNLLYRTEEKGLYHIHTWGWTYIAENEKFKECVLSCTEELENVFGNGSIRDFVWPNGEQDNPEILRWLETRFRSLRRTGNTKDSTGFALPEDRMHWRCNANYTCLSEVVEQYDRFPDDGTLKFFCFGVHAHDFENNHCWNLLEELCNRLGNRPQDFWYATVGEIFDYEDAVHAVETTDSAVRNVSATELYLSVNGHRAVLPAGAEIHL